MKRVFLLALMFLAACTGTQGEHDPVALIVATDIGGQAALQVVETKNLQALVGNPLVVHDGFTKVYPAGTEIVQLLAPGRHRSELWVLYTQGGGVFIDIFTPGSIVLNQPAPLTPTDHVQIATTETPHGFAVNGNLIALREGDGVGIYDRQGAAVASTVVVNDPFELAPVFVNDEVYFWSESISNILELVPRDGFEKFSFGAIGNRPPAVTADKFDPAIFVHVGANGLVALFDPAQAAEPVTATAAELGTAQQAQFVGSRLLVRTTTALEQVRLVGFGDTFEAELVGRDSLHSQDIVVFDPYNQYAYPLGPGTGKIISTLGGAEPGSPNGAPPRQQVHNQVALPSLGTPQVGEAFIVRSSL